MAARSENDIESVIIVTHKNELTISAISESVMQESIKYDCLRCQLLFCTLGVIRETSDRPEAESLKAQNVLLECLAQTEP
jgi:hypothetical protein